MNATQALHQLGQSLWLDNITRSLLQSGTLARYIRDLSVTGLTSNPTIFEHAIGNSDSYDASIRALSEALSDKAQARSVCTAKVRAGPDRPNNSLSTSPKRPWSS